MSIESTQPHAAEEPPESPELLLDSLDGKVLDEQFKEWGSQARHPSNQGKNLADTIIEDCTIIDDVKFESGKTLRITQSTEDRSLRTKYLTQLYDIAKQAHNAQLDLPVQDQAYANHFAKVFEWIAEGGHSESFIEAYTHLRRLFVARELLIFQTGKTGFDKVDLNFVFERLIEDERRLNKVNPL